MDKLLLLLSLMLVMGGCIDEFRPDVDGYDRRLVIDGRITNSEGPYTVRLVRSIGVYGYEYQEEPVTGAEVSILEEGGAGAVLTEVEPGVYRTELNDLRGTPGRRYRLAVHLADDTRYESDWELLRAPTRIDTVEHQLEYQYIPALQQQMPGYKFYVSTAAAEQPVNYYLYFLEATYKYRSDFQLYDVYRGSSERVRPRSRDSLRTCWRTYVVEELFATSTTGYASTELRQIPLHFVRADLKELSIRYSLLTRQLTIGPEAYTFWKAMANQVSNTGSLYNRQPYQVRGNVYNIDAPDEAVLGYFLVAGEDTSRIFVNKPDVELKLPRCFVDTLALQFLGFTTERDWPIYLTVDRGIYGVGPFGCIDCRDLGGVLERPGFWVE